ncbi:uncharacterized protein METZ01_LOCUS367155, partial [marine metagenome]
VNWPAGGTGTIYLVTIGYIIFYEGRARSLQDLSFGASVVNINPLHWGK